ncbi:MAG: long-chain fatty acid--CoA ligase [Chloroflexi bacterium]|nr:long-chain fatty acid--CoA ligase [Chloroflexota bacterium]
MMDYPLTLQHFLDRVARLYPTKEIATKIGPTMHRYTYADWAKRVNRLAGVLERLGVARGERVGTLAWNTYRHYELYFAVPCAGRVLHTLNLRLPPDQLVYVINHAEDQVIFADASLVPLLDKIKGHLKSVKHFVVMADGALPASALSPVSSYEELLAAESDSFAWPHLEENEAAAMCYTSGTTGNPKAALYSHRAIFLHSLAQGMSGSFGISERDIVLPVVPMFHANAWGLPFTSTMVGAKQVFPGPHLSPPDLLNLIQSERVTITAGVPTIWIGILAELERNGHYDISSLRTMPVGGSAVPRALMEKYEKKYGVPITQAWGMTEMTPLGTVSVLKSYMADWPEERRFDYRVKQGMPSVGVDIRAVDEDGKEVPWDGKTMGELEVRGPWIISAYYKMEGNQDRFHDGWFRTGDVVSIDPEGYIQIVDRTKDLVKSGGEWISSVDLENAIMAHPKVLEAAVIAINHPRWQERPLALVVAKADFKGQISKEEIQEMLAAKFTKWWVPDDVVFIDAVPKTSVGKFDKKVLRDQFKDHVLPA